MIESGDIHPVEKECASMKIQGQWRGSRIGIDIDFVWGQILLHSKKDVLFWHKNYKSQVKSQKNSYSFFHWTIST